MAEVCPIVGTTNTVLPPKHPDFDANQPGLVCPVTKATTDHHHNLSKHPGIFNTTEDLSNAEACPALSKIVSRPEQQAMDEAICPVVGSVSSVLPPNHPSTTNAKEGDVCPVTNATLDHHKGKVQEHPSLQTASKDAVCPVVHKHVGE
ncbi:hypothetical protein H2202_005059 [Exophiala xenobiotica]|jgi:hypothetical protein|nr:hypothetical protein H2202_005059 [Exophiala xenobiotica]KAK5205458.1 hypothetical protein LTR41_008912 [Exophiala xenobiotica]KAK5220411.1 hypothetical protein LTR72_007033 [Exophiala xenobiotica]KAK5233373.1 hypothetical protein LTR47_005466 [Exophiala xenobiotica]KAK5245871.1 hypothetical protein LTS06_008771 [Exophiala xenobiotica]